MKEVGSDHEFMARAIRLALQGLYTTQPNPRVGCVLVKDGRVVGEGWHVRAGSDHAEVIAIRQAGDRARGSTCYVTLEPCAHTGRTPPCTDALIKAGVAKVHAASVDPNPLVAGNGLAILGKNGIIAEVGLLEQQAQSLNPGFFKRMQSGMPYIRCKLGISVDGKTALASGESKWITGEAARHDVQHLRARSCAIMTGITTVLTDDPSLTVRNIDTRDTQPLRVVLDRKLRLPEQARLVQQPGRTLVFTLNKDKAAQLALLARGVEVVTLEEDTFLESVLHYLADKKQINELLVEAGATLSGSLVKAGLLDELVIYQAPVLLGDSGKGMFSFPPLTDMRGRIQLELGDLRHIGEDLRFTYMFRSRS